MSNQKRSGPVPKLTEDRNCEHLAICIRPDQKAALRALADEHETGMSQLAKRYLFNTDGTLRPYPHKK